MTIREENIGAEKEMVDLLIDDHTIIGGFAMIGNDIIRNPEVSDGMFRTYCVLKSLINDRQAYAFPSMEALASWIGVSKRTAIRYVRELEKVDLVELIERKGHSNMYKVKLAQNSKVLRDVDKIKAYLENGKGKPKELGTKKDPSQGNGKDPGKPAIKINYKDIIAYLNEKAGKNFLSTSKANQDLMKARWGELHRAGLDAEQIMKEFKYVIDVKVAHWKGDPKNDKFLRPSTLFRPGNFDRYRNETTADIPELYGKKEEKISDIESRVLELLGEDDDE